LDLKCAAKQTATLRLEPENLLATCLVEFIEPVKLRSSSADLAELLGELHHSDLCTNDVPFSRHGVYRASIPLTNRTSTMLGSRVEDRNFLVRRVETFLSIKSRHAHFRGQSYRLGADCATGIDW
jgi:hypothetical protein